MAQYAYELAKAFNQFYAEVTILNEPNRDLLLVRLALSELVGQTIKRAMGLLGIEVPEKM
jgi:arginyl-tRNA synthetase